jgi:hypothetical protein
VACFSKSVAARTIKLSIHRCNKLVTKHIWVIGVPMVKEKYYFKTHVACNSKTAIAMKLSNNTFHHMM